MPESNHEQRLADLESLLQFQDDTINALNEEVALQQKHIMQLQKKLDLLISRMQDNSFAMGNAEDEPPPPHY